MNDSDLGVRLRRMPPLPPEVIWILTFCLLMRDVHVAWLSDSPEATTFSPEE